MFRAFSFHKEKGSADTTRPSRGSARVSRQPSRTVRDAKNPGPPGGANDEPSKDPAAPSARDKADTAPGGDRAVRKHRSEIFTKGGGVGDGFASDASGALSPRGSSASTATTLHQQRAPSAAAHPGPVELVASASEPPVHRRSTTSTTPRASEGAAGVGAVLGQVRRSLTATARPRGGGDSEKGPPESLQAKLEKVSSMGGSAGRVPTLLTQLSSGLGGDELTSPFPRRDAGSSFSPHSTASTTARDFVLGASRDPEGQQRLRQRCEEATLALLSVERRMRADAAAAALQLSGLQVERSALEARLEAREQQLQEREEQLAMLQEQLRSLETGTVEGAEGRAREASEAGGEADRLHKDFMGGADHEGCLLALGEQKRVEEEGTERLRGELSELASELQAVQGSKAALELRLQVLEEEREGAAEASRKAEEKAARLLLEMGKLQETNSLLEQRLEHLTAAKGAEEALEGLSRLPSEWEEKIKRLETENAALKMELRKVEEEREREREADLVGEESPQDEVETVVPVRSFFPRQASVPGTRVSVRPSADDQLAKVTREKLQLAERLRRVTAAATTAAEASKKVNEVRKELEQAKAEAQALKAANAELEERVRELIEGKAGSGGGSMGESAVGVAGMGSSKEAEEELETLRGKVAALEAARQGLDTELYTQRAFRAALEAKVVSLNKQREALESSLESTRAKSSAPPEEGLQGAVPPMEGGESGVDSAKSADGLAGGTSSEAGELQKQLQDAQSKWREAEALAEKEVAGLTAKLQEAFEEKRAIEERLQRLEGELETQKKEASKYAVQMKFVAAAKTELERRLRKELAEAEIRNAYLTAELAQLEEKLQVHEVLSSFGPPEGSATSQQANGVFFLHPESRATKSVPEREITV